MATNKSPWHSLSAQKVLDQFHSSTAGLDPLDIHQYRQQYGLNVLEIAKARAPWLRFLSQFNNILIYMLLFSAVVAIFLQYWIDTSVILGVVFLNALIGFIQEGKAEEAIQAISQMLSPQALVIRQGQHYRIPAEELVPGDLVILKSGDKVPADLRLLSTKSLRIQEAILTGESLSVNKSVESVSADAELYERSCMAYSGTVVDYGVGTGVVVATGQYTEIGRISSMLSSIPMLTTPLMKQIERFGRWLTAVILLMSVVAFVAGVVFRHYSIEHMFMAAISLIVAAIPEGLPAIMTITLAIGVTRMAKQHAIIRRLPAVETMGSVDVICTDKTGTLTRNELLVQNITTVNREYKIDHNNSLEHAHINCDQKDILLEDHFVFEEMIKIASLCNEAEIHEETSGHTIFGDPIDKALLLLGLQANVDISLTRQSFPRHDLIPFESEHKFMASLHHDHDGNTFIYVKGSPEKLLRSATLQLTEQGEEPLDLRYWEKKIEYLASKGLRVLAIAMKRVTQNHRILSFSDTESDLVFLGVLGLIDPPRHGVKAAIERSKAAHVAVKMITGDHALTAKTIADQIGIYSERVLTGHELDQMSEHDLQQIVEEVNVYARTSPEHKLKLVQALRNHGHVVAMTGDGVNDAPALRQADIGIAMGQKGTEATKEVAEMVLADDNFVSISQAIQEGRTVYDNLKKAMAFILPTNLGESLVILLAILIGQTFPITPLQILWINMVTTVTLTLALSFERAELNVMNRPPRSPQAMFLSPIFIWRLFYVGFLLVACVFGLFMIEMQTKADLVTARTLVVNMLVIGECVYLFHCRRLYEVEWNPLHLRKSPVMILAIVGVIILQILFTYVPIFQHFFHTASISLIQWAKVLGFAAALYLFIGLEKKLVGCRWN